MKLCCRLFRMGACFLTLAAGESQTLTPAQPVSSSGQIAKRSGLPAQLSLADALQHALTNNAGILQAQQEVVVAQRQAGIARAQRWPILSADGGERFRVRPTHLFMATKTGDFTDTRFSRNVFTYGANAFIPIYTGGRIRQDILIADLGLQLSDLRLRQTRDDLIFNVSGSYYRILSLEKVVEARQRSVDALEEARRVLELQVRVGRAAQVDLLRVESRLANVRQDLVQARNLLDVTYYVLNTLLGIDDPSYRPRLTEKLEFQPYGVSLLESIEKALQQRPEFRARQLELEIQRHRVEAAKAVQRPQVALNVALYAGMTGIHTRGIIGNRTSDAQSDWGALVGVTFPFFDLNLRRRQSREEAAVVSAQRAVDKARLDITLEVERAYLNILNAAERVRATEAGLTSAREAFRIQTLALNVGRGIITDLLQSQAELLAAEEQNAAALADHKTAQVELQRAIGEIPVP